MVTVYRIHLKIDDFQYVLSDETTIDLCFEGSKKKDLWKAPKSYFPYPIRPEPDFWGCFLDSSIFAITQEILEIIQIFVSQSCELLPLSVEGRELEIVNTTLVLNCLDKEKSEYDPLRPHDIDKYVFHPNRFHFSLFTFHFSKSQKHGNVKYCVSRVWLHLKMNSKVLLKQRD